MNLRHRFSTSHRARVVLALFLASIIVAAFGSTGVAAGLASARQSTTALTWTRGSSPTKPNPPARDFAAMAFYPPTHSMVLFGGSSSTQLLGDTWAWNGATWTQLFPPSSPSPRLWATMAFDAATQSLVLFGGEDSTGMPNDTWTWNGTTWTQQFPLNSPSPRIEVAMDYDAARRVVFLFGGVDSQARTLGDAWGWTGSTWEVEGTGPAPRANASLAYDTGTTSMVLFGGQSTAFTGSSALGDTWTWDGVWTQRLPTVSPQARLGAGMTYNYGRGAIVLFGGSGGPLPAQGALNGPAFGDTWEWTGSNWVSVQPTASPPPHVYSTLVYDGATSSAVLFGGAITPLLPSPPGALYPSYDFIIGNDTWVLK